MFDFTRSRAISLSSDAKSRFSLVFNRFLRRTLMSSVWNFVKRHRGKLALGGVLVGGAYVARRLLQQDAVQSQLAQLMPAADGDKKSYIFDSNQETCETSIKQLVPSIQDKVLKRFDIESLVDGLKDAENDAQKLEIWNKIKVQSLARLLSTAYGLSLLMTSLKVQVSILAGQIYASAKRNEPGLLARMGRMVGAEHPTPVEMDASTQQLFLQCIQYFTLHGLDTLMEKIELMVARFLEPMSLKEMFTLERLEEVIGEIRMEIEAADLRNFSYLIVPLTANQDAFSVPHHHNRLESLLNHMKQVLETDQCRKLIRECASRFCRQIIVFSNDKCPQLQHNSGVPLAKLVPVLTDCVDALSSMQFDTPVQDILISPSLHNFCLKVFEEFSE